MKLSELIRDNGTYLAYAYPGGYPIIYYDEEGNTLCPECASRESEYNSPISSGDIYWKGLDIQCNDCENTISSAYGNPEE